MIIGLIGKARAGKDKAADHLVQNYGFTKAAFADGVKDFAEKHFHVPHEELYGEKSPLTRRILQGIGDGCREEFGHGIWIDQLWKATRDIDDLVISDVRYLNEAASIKGMGGFLVKVFREGGSRVEYNEAHVSEMEQDKITPNLVLHNDSDLSTFLETVDEAFVILKARVSRLKKIKQEEKE